MKQKITDGLEICFKTANILKENFPNEIMKIKDDTIIPFSKQNSRKAKTKSMSGCYACYTCSKPHRVIVRQKVLAEKKCLGTKINNQSKRNMLYGNFALVELMCHELAHHKTKGHAKGFKIKYNRFLGFMVNQILSGKFYQNHT